MNVLSEIPSRVTEHSGPPYYFSLFQWKCGQESLFKTQFSRMAPPATKISITLLRYAGPAP